ncbi:hypothetical protein PRZ48_006560 [Zasmidium cellare]|uniref:BTB domain-containing protein n=1 Tax=Zasmidium cellare TaxID=395010 RepID=A0ABR0EPM1_ZASCE|nr:hypothetical protein PRZ48_006560 [Zasmidium cellare]
MPKDPGQAPAQLASAIPNGKYSDLVVECDGHSWRVHKAVLCTQSSFFTKACEGNTWNEASSGIVTLPDDHPEAVCAVMQYLYTSDYQVKSTPGQTPTLEPLVLDVLVYTLADKLDVQPLVQFAAKRFCVRLQGMQSELWKTAAFPEAIRELYLNAPDTDRKMHKTVMEISTAHAVKLLTESYGLEFRKVVEEVKTFGTEFQLAAISRRQDYVDGAARYFCSNRSKVVILPEDQPSCPACKKPEAHYAYSKTHFRIEQW